MNSDDLGGPGIVINVGGEGEVADAIDVNNLVMPRRPVERFVHTGRFVLGDAAALPIRAGVAVEVVGNRLPSGFPAWRAGVAAEAARVLRPGGRARIWSEAGSHIWLGPLADAGLTGVTIEDGYAIGVKP